MKDINKLQTVKGDIFEKNDVYIEVNSPAWRTPNKISLNELLNNIDVPEFNFAEYIDKNTLIIDPDTLKIKVNENKINVPSVHYEFIKKDNISISQLPKDVSELTGLHLMSDSNYLYVFVENKWKRIPFSAW